MVKRFGLRLRLCCGIVVSAVLAGVAGAETFKWVDEDGNVHYGDRPPAEVPATEQVPSYVCETEACRAEDEAAARESEARTQEIMQWLEAREAEKVQAAENAAAEREAGGNEREVYVVPPAGRGVPVLPPYAVEKGMF